MMTAKAYTQLFFDTHYAQEGELFTLSTEKGIRAVVEAAFDEAAKLFDGYNYGPFENPGATIRALKQSFAAEDKS